jgi:hypothetical protein
MRAAISADDYQRLCELAQNVPADPIAVSREIAQINQRAAGSPLSQGTISEECSVVFGPPAAPLCPITETWRRPAPINIDAPRLVQNGIDVRTIFQLGHAAGLEGEFEFAMCFP